MEINEELSLKIKEICDEGDVFIELGEYRSAFDNFEEALDLIPTPKESYSVTAGVMAGLGDVYFKSGSFEQAKETFSASMYCVGAIGNPYLHLRLGQSQFELGNTNKAIDELARAYMGAGKEIFESDDPKYFDFLTSKLSPPAGGEW
ncbi:tetratricopeptide repeat protein [Grimontia kaedaensis]|uniref:Tetratricopeptide repeat protein n=1 Tax=Grimontia kaedaensis TaxID=2872157 RepID=A0ABY4WXX9_9GAMM|nr:MULTISPECIES: tetratricopeptide repeat protein [Vibrionaceae]MCG3865498.1 tetratricopeptide repeat protein [Photobacterium sp. Ph6]MCG3877023.1 tetratricopeptide repeat protein [Photobacterium sp. Ph5]USH03831.1 tetratricopeptide repeat protein [Grimontia kaedaensis]